MAEGASYATSPNYSRFPTITYYEAYNIALAFASRCISRLNRGEALGKLSLIMNLDNC